MIPPAQLWLGSPAALARAATQFVQQQCCAHNGCEHCSTCTAIAHQQYHRLTWLYPEKNYTVDDMDTILQTCAFALEPEQRYFFVLSKADYLSTACANRLLKIVEEPPRGYHFIFLAQRLHAILPTIQSRCIIKHITGIHQESASALVTMFKNPLSLNAATFAKALDQENPHEGTTVELLDGLLQYWLHTHKQHPTATSARMIAVVEQALQEPPMPGGSKIFWRNVYLQVQSRLL